jgi:hypothetical protein
MRMPSIACVLMFAFLASANRSPAQSATSGAAPTKSTGDAAVGAARSVPPSRVTAMHGTLEKVDASARTIIVKMRDGDEASLHFDDATVVHGLGPLENAAMLAGEEGMNVVVRYTDDKMARSIVLTGGAAFDLAIGTVVTFDRTAKTLLVTSVDGTKQLFQLGEYCTINTARGVEEVLTTSGHVLKKGGLVVLYFSEESGRKVVRAIDEISHSA